MNHIAAAVLDVIVWPLMKLAKAWDDFTMTPNDKSTRLDL